MPLLLLLGKAPLLDEGLALPRQLLKADYLGLVGFDQPSVRPVEPLNAGAQPVVGGLPSAVLSLGQEALILRRQVRGIPEQACHVLPDGLLQALRLDLRPRALRLAGRRERVHPGAAK